MMKTRENIFKFLIALILFLSGQAMAQQRGTLTLTFMNTVKGRPVIKGNAIYRNSLGEDFSITKLKYYVSHAVVRGRNEFRDEGYYLIDEGKRNSISLSVPAGSFEGIGFLFGIDSLKHCSGAQEGDLDPLMDMFWTWNSGYVIFKLEGNSPSSGADLERIEHHIGGYKGDNNVSKEINLSFPSPVSVAPGENKEVFIEMDLDKYWNSSVPVYISKDPVITKPGEDAVKVSANFKNMFSFHSIR